MLLRSWLATIAITVLLAACSSSPKQETVEQSPGEVVQSAAQAFVDGYNSHDLAEFHSFFATTGQGADALGLDKTLYAADKELDNAGDSYTAQIRNLQIDSEQVDEKNNIATVTYRATVSIVRNGTDAVFSGFVNQDVALIREGTKWLISGGDAPQITPNVPTTAP